MSEMTPPPPPPPPAMPPSQPAMPMSSPPPNNNLVWAILTTILCCLPFGIVAIIKAAEVNGKWAQGDYAGAQASADAAKKWSIVSAVVGGAGVALYLIFVVGLGVLSASTS